MERLPGLLVLKRVQQGHRSIEIELHCFRAGCQKVDGAYFFCRELVLVFLSDQNRRSRPEASQE
jgi:hypothetical protein